MKLVKLQENKVRIGLAKGKSSFPEDCETKDTALNNELETDFSTHELKDASLVLTPAQKRTWDVFFKNYTCPDFELDRSVAQDVQSREFVP